MDRTDCFGYKRAGLCKALTKMDCSKCKFYKPRGTECDTCPHKGKTSCKQCYWVENRAEF